MVLSIIRCKKNWLQLPSLNTKKISCKSYKSILNIEIEEVHQNDKFYLTSFYMQNISLKYKNKAKL